MTTELVKTGQAGAVVVDETTLAAIGMTEDELAAAHGIIGMENARPEDFQIPRLQIAQALSPQLARNKPEYIPGLMVGQFFNTVTNQIYGDSVVVIPIKYSVSRLRFLNTQIDCRSNDGVQGPRSPIVVDPVTKKQSGGCAQCQFSKWGTGKDGKGTDCKEYRNWLLLDTNDGLPMSISFKSSSLIVAKNWGTQIASRKIKLSNGAVVQAPAYMTMFEIRSAEKQSALGTFYVPVVRALGAPSADLIKIASDISKSFKGEIADNAVDHEE